MKGSAAREELLRMVEEQIVRRGIRDERVLDAMREVPRQLFVPEESRLQAFRDGPLGIGHGQTISQPYIVAYMTELLDLSGEERVLEIGTGSGYQTAVLSRLSREVFSMELIPELLQTAARRVAALGCRNVEFRGADGKQGWPELAPFDRVIVSAAAREFPAVLAAQLGEGGVMVWPQGDLLQRIYRLQAGGKQALPEELIPVSFVPLV